MRGMPAKAGAEAGRPTSEMMIIRGRAARRSTELLALTILEHKTKRCLIGLQPIGSIGIRTPLRHKKRLPKGSLT